MDKAEPVNDQTGAKSAAVRAELLGIRVCHGGNVAEAGLALDPLDNDALKLHRDVPMDVNHVVSSNLCRHIKFDVWCFGCVVEAQTVFCLKRHAVGTKVLNAM